MKITNMLFDQRHSYFTILESLYINHTYFCIILTTTLISTPRKLGIQFRLVSIIFHRF